MVVGDQLSVKPGLLVCSFMSCSKIVPRLGIISPFSSLLIFGHFQLINIIVYDRILIIFIKFEGFLNGNYVVFGYPCPIGCKIEKVTVKRILIFHTL